MTQATMTHDEQRPDYRGLATLLLLLVVGAVVLNATAGLPHLPPRLPSWSVTTATLRGSSLPLGVLGYVLMMAAWAVWFWIVASLLLRLVVAGADAVSGGAGWVRTLRTISDRVTLPIVRRMVDGALITVLVVNVVSRTVPVAGAASPPATPQRRVATTQRTMASGTSPHREKQSQRPRSINYTVQPGDTLWGISERFYGTGYEYPRLVAANVGREMGDGERFTRTGVLQPGWVLRVPLPSQSVTQVDGRPYYVVEEGDSLRGIAARLLGDENRWTVLFDLNRDRARLNGHVLADPDLIWPGLRLRLPDTVPEHRSPPAGGTPTKPHPRHRRPIPRSSPVVLTPTPTRPRPTPIATRVAPVPTAAAVPTPSTHAGGGAGDETDLVAGVAGAVAAALAGGAVVAARRRVRRSLNEPPVPKSRTARHAEEFAEVEPARVLRHQIYGDGSEPIVALVEQILRLLARRNMRDVSLLTVRQGQNTATLLLRAGPREHEALLQLEGELATTPRAKCRVSTTPDHDIALKVSGPKSAALIPRVARHGVELTLLPVGLVPGDEMLHVNWRELGHILISGLPGGGADVILTSVIAALTARRRPDTLRLWTIADHRSLPASLAQLPHQISAFLDVGNEIEVGEVLSRLRSELTCRMQADEAGHPWRPSVEQPEIVLVVGELGDLPDDGTTLELIGTHGPAHGIRLLAASARADTVDDAILGHFGTRFVLQTMDDDESIRLVGVPEAADLAGGEFLLQVASRRAISVRGLRVSTERLDELVRTMREEGGGLAPTRWSIRTVDASEVSATSPNGAQVVEEDGEVASLDGPQGENVSGLADDEHESMLEAKSVLDESAVEEIEAEEPAVSGVVENLNTNGHTPVLPEKLDELTEIPTAEVEVPAARTMVEVRCFGEFTVRSGDREITPYGEEGPSYKSWEILAFLTSQPDAAVSKDKLVAAVWPDVTTDRAGNRLNVALARLRSLLTHQIPELPADVVRVDREGICRLDPTLVASDVHQFNNLIHDASRMPPDEAKVALGQARALYRGDLLAGRGARFYEWLDDRDDSGVTLREHYREEYYRTTQRLARMFFEEGQAAQAVPLYKDLLKAEPTLEDVVRELYRCYRQLGDLNSLIREDRHLRQALRDAYAELEGPEGDPEDYQPEHETVTLFEETRKELLSEVAEVADK